MILGARAGIAGVNVHFLSPSARPSRCCKNLKFITRDWKYYNRPKRKLIENSNFISDYKILYDDVSNLNKIAYKIIYLSVQN